MRLIKALVAMIVGLVVLAGAALFLLPTQRIAMLAAGQFQAATGRNLVVAGPVRASFYPVIGARMSDIRIGNPDWAGAAPFLQADTLEIGLSLPALIRGDIEITRIILDAAQIDLQRDAQGRANWDISPPAAVLAPAPATGTTQPPTARAPAAARSVSIAEARLTNSRVRYRDAINGRNLDLTDLDATLTLAARDGELALDATGRLSSAPLQVSLRSPDAQALFNGSAVPLVMRAQLAGASVSFDGRTALETFSFEGALDATIPALRPVLAALGETGGDLAADWLPLGLTGQVTRTGDGALFARDARFRAGRLDLTGAADLRLDGPRPNLSGSFTGQVLDLRSARGAGGGGGTGAPAQPGWSRAPIDASALNLLDADVTLALQGLESDVTTLGPTRLRATIDRARAVFDLQQVALFGGNLTGEFVANNRSGLSVGGNLQARGVDLRPLLTELANYTRLQGPMDADLQFLGVGNNMQAIMSSLRGEGRLSLGQGQLDGFDLAGMLRSLDMNYMGEGRRTVYRSVTGSFTMDSGVLRNRDLRVDAGDLTVSGDGRIDLGARTLDYSLIPVAFGDRDDGGLRVPLIVTGPWDAPRFRLDLEALAREQLREERERLEAIAREEAQRLEERAREAARAEEQRLRSRAEQVLERELGVQRQDGERIEDTLRRGVEEGVGRALRGLLGGN
jgi:AsmA protein